jgi:drug/metabolite transporter (DMT)-like permease
MSSTVFIAVIGAAVLHAAWNALLKGGRDKKMSMGAIVLGHIPLAVILLPFMPMPTLESLPYLAAGIVLHAGYQLFLLKSYQTGDLTQVYPIARGSAPLIVTVFSVVILGVTLEPLQLIAILTIGLGIISLALVRRTDGQRNSAAARLALTTGLFIASYSLVDGLGARLAGNSWGFYSWLTIGNGIVLAAYLALTAPETFGNIARHGRGVFLLGGGASFLAYGVVTWAFTQAPIALVTALRETSIVFALLMGIFFLKERLNLIKVCSTFLTLLGAVLLRYAKD